jgi:TolA-binding protein
MALSLFISFVGLCSFGQEIELKDAAEVWLRRAFEAAGKQEWKVADQELRKFALTRIPNPRADHLHACVAYRDGRFADAAQKFHAVLKQKPDSFAAWYHLGKCLLELKHYSQAIEALKKAGTAAEHEIDEPWYPREESGVLQPPNRGTHVNLLMAKAYVRWAEAMAALREPEEAKLADALLDQASAILAKPVQEAVHPSLRVPLAFVHAELLYQQEQYAESQKEFEAIARQLPQHPLAPSALLQVARCVEKGKSPDEAISFYKDVVVSYPKSDEAAEAQIQIGLTHFNSRRYSEAREAFLLFLKAFAAHESAPKVDFKIGLTCLLQAKETDKGACARAGERFETFCERYPKSPLGAAALLWAGECFLRAGDAEKAKQMFERREREFPDAKGPWRKRKLSPPIFDRISEME